MRAVAGLLVALVVFAGCAPLRAVNHRPYEPHELALLSKETDSPYTNYENVWAATLAVMRRNYSVARADKERGIIESHPSFRHTSFLTLKKKVFATIIYEDGFFIPQIKVVVFTDTSEADAFSPYPSRRTWRQLIDSGQRATELEEDVRRILLPQEYRSAPKPSVPERSDGGVKPSKA